MMNSLVYLQKSGIQTLASPSALDTVRYTMFAEYLWENKVLDKKNSAPAYLRN